MLPRRALLAAAVLVAGSISAAEDESTVLRGRVLDPAVRPVAGATVRLLPSGISASAPTRDPATWVSPVVARTGEDGRFAVTGPRAEAYAVRVEAPDFAPHSAESVPAGATLDVRLVPGHRVAGRVLDEREKTPVAGARVRAWDLAALIFGDLALLETRSDEEGRFVFEHAPEGELHLEALSPAHARSTERRLEVPVRAGAAEIVLFLRPGGRVSGRVVDLEHHPVEGARVELLAEGSGAGDAIDVGTRTRPGFVYSAVDGSFDLEGVPAGKGYRASAVKPGWPWTRSASFAVEHGGHARDVEVQLSPQAVLALTLLDPEGEPARTKLGIRLCSEGSLQGGDCDYGRPHVPDEWIRAADGGRHTVENLAAGHRDVLIDPQGFAAVEREAVVLRAGETTDLGTIRLDRGRTLAGRVGDAGGLGIADAEVTASFDTGRGGRRIEVRTAADGRYELAGLGAGPLARIEVSAKGYVGAEKREVPVEEARVDFTLERAGGVRGRAVRRAGGALPAFRVFVNAEAAEELGFARQPSRSDSERFTDREGRFEVGDLAPGTYTVEVQPEGLARARRSGVKVTGGETVDLGRIEVDEGRTLRVRVVAGEDDAPVAGARVDVAAFGNIDTFTMLIDRYEHGHSKPETDTDGRFEAAGLVPGTVTVQVAHPDFAPQEQRVEIPEETTPSETVVRLSQGGVVAGTVRDGAGGPVVEAGVYANTDALLSGSLENYRAVTGPDGRYEIRRVRPGTYSVGCFIRGRDPAQHESETAVVREGETTVVDFGAGARIVLSGVARRGDSPLARATLLFLRPDGDADAMDSEADAAGHYEVGLDLPGTWLVTAQEGRSPGSGPPVQIVVPDEPRVNADIAFPGGAISGTVRDAEGQPVPDATVVGRPEGEGENEWSAFGAQTEASGRYTLDSLSPGTYRLTATAPGFRSQTREAALGAEGPADGIDFRLERGRAMWGRVVDPQGAAIAEADVLVVPVGGDPIAAAGGRTDRLGAFRITAPAEGPLDVTVLALGWAPLRISGVLPPERHDDPGLELRVGPGGSLRVRIVDATGRPLAGLRPVARPTPLLAGMDYLFLFDPVPPTDAGGESVIERLAPGDYEVRVAGREDDPPVRVTVINGAEAVVTLQLPAE